MDLEEYLENARHDRMYYASAAERMLKAIGEPRLVDTRNDPRLSKIFMNRTIRVYDSFSDFYGMEEVIERLVGFFRHAAQGLEERKQVLYLLGPVGGGKSSLAERLKELMEKYPIYVLAFETENGLQMSPVFESPLCLFNTTEQKEFLENEYGIHRRYVPSVISPWALKRLEEIEGDESKIKVVEIYPSRLKQIAVVKTEPGDENNQDISSLVGKVDLRKLDRYPQNDPDAYSYSGALCRGNQGLVEFVEMFKAPIKTLHPLLTATQEGNFVGTEEIGAMPFNGIILAHSNESEWQQFRNNKNNEAFLDRIYIVKVPYCLRYTEESKIYEKMVKASDLTNAPCAPQTLTLLAQWSVMTRLKPHPSSPLHVKMKVYNGDENVHEMYPTAKSLVEYKEAAGVNEGMDGMSTRFAFKVLSRTFNYDPDEVAADPVHLFHELEVAVTNEQLPEEKQKAYIEFIKEYLIPTYAEFLENEIQKAYVENYDELGQSMFERYFYYASAWCENSNYKDPDTGEIYDREYLNKELTKIEKPANISNPKDFRQEVVNFILKAQVKNQGKMPDWKSYEKMRRVIESKIFANMEEMLPIISFGQKPTQENEEKHKAFINRMKEKGYTEKQIRRLVEWYLRVRKSS